MTATSDNSHRGVDVLVIGGGPAGCAAALAAHREGAQVLVVEQEPHQRHRIGEILLTQTVLEMKNLGIADEMAEFAEQYQWGKKFGAAYVHGADRTPWRVQNNHPLASSQDQPHIPRSFVRPDTGLWYTLMVRRHEFDEALRTLLQRRGIEIVHGRAKAFRMYGDEINQGLLAQVEVETLDGGRLVIAPKTVVDATGQFAFVPRKLKVREKVGDWALKAKYAYFKDVDFAAAQAQGFYQEGANILQHAGGWTWIAHLGRGVTSVGVVSPDWDQPFWDKLAQLPEHRLFGLDRATVVDYQGNPAAADFHYAHPDYRWRSKTMRGRNWVCAGDAAMFLDPLLSQGVTLAMFFGGQAGKACAGVASGSMGPEAFASLERGYVHEIEVLNKVVSLWYQPDFTFDTAWMATAEKLTNLFGRPIGRSIESFRWISNLENIHHLINSPDESTFLAELNDVNNIAAIHRFEQNGFVVI